MVLLALVAIPAVAYVAVDGHILVAAAIFVSVLPILAIVRPALLLVGMVPLCLLGREFPQAWLVQGAAVALLLAWGVHLALGGSRLRWPHVPIALLGIALAVSGLAPVMRLDLVESPTSNLGGASVGLMLLALAATFAPHPRLVAGMIAVTGAVAALYAMGSGEHLGGRLMGVTLSPNYLGALLAIATTAAVGLAWYRRQPWWLIAAMPSAAALIWTGSRGALVAVGAGLLTVAIGVRSGRNSRMAAVLLVIVIAAGLWFAGNIALSERSAEQLGYNNDLRTEVARVAFDLALTHPIRGIGFGQFPGYLLQVSSLGRYLNTHNDYLRIAAEAGVGALALFVALLWLALKDRRSGELAVLRGVVAAFAVDLLFANTLFNIGVSAAFWVALGCLLSHPQVRRSVRRRAPEAPLPAAEPAHTIAPMEAAP